MAQTPRAIAEQGARADHCLRSIAVTKCLLAPFNTGTAPVSTVTHCASEGKYADPVPFTFPVTVSRGQSRAPSPAIAAAIADPTASRASATGEPTERTYRSAIAVVL